MQTKKGDKKMEKVERYCPICNYKYTEPPAISRLDNKTEICPICGLKEAIQAWKESVKEGETK